MYLEIKKTKLKDVLIIKPPTIFKDFRGQYIETYNNKIYQKNSINIKFIQDDVSVSKKNVLRGIHGDNKTWKLVSCLYGSFYLVVLNYDRKSKSFGNYISIVLSDKNNLQVLIPPKHGNGHFVLSKQVIFHYKQNTLYEKKSQFTVKWNDSRFKIRWPTKNPILSKRDNLEQ